MFGVTLTEGVISYKLRFPFNEFIKVTNPDDNKPLPYEPMESLADKGVEANDNENIQSGYMNFCEPKIMQKKQEVALKNATSLSSGWGGWKRVCQPIKTLILQGVSRKWDCFFRQSVTPACHTL